MDDECFAFLSPVPIDARPSGDPEEPRLPARLSVELPPGPQGPQITILCHIVRIGPILTRAEHVCPHFTGGPDPKLLKFPLDITHHSVIRKGCRRNLKKVPWNLLKMSKIERKHQYVMFFAHDDNCTP
jgi:hypothetical protein